MFREQLRAMLRAREGADLGIMLPMVSGVEEVLEAKREIELAAAALAERGVGHNARPRIGAMVELPSAAMAVGDLAAETDFLSTRPCFGSTRRSPATAGASAGSSRCAGT